MDQRVLQDFSSHDMTSAVPSFISDHGNFHVFKFATALHEQDH